jgi:Zn-dependent protease
LGIDLSRFNWQTFILEMAVLIIAITIHEFAHAITADKLGDPTPRSQGRISLLPPDHLDPIGTIMMVVSSFAGYGLGWGKPVMTNPRNFKNPRRDSGIVAIAGPISNILQAIVFAIILRLVGENRVWDSTTGYLSTMGIFLTAGLITNLSLAVFNMLPIGPLDGHWVVQSILPLEQSEAYRRFNDQYGMIIFLGLVLMARPLLSQLMTPAMVTMMQFLEHYIVGFTIH